jgi:hypothetical protein
MEVLRTGVGNLYPEAAAHTRIPAGHPEGYLEAFANIYRNFAICLRARLKGKNPIRCTWISRRYRMVYEACDSSKGWCMPAAVKKNG